MTTVRDNTALACAGALSAPLYDVINRRRDVRSQFTGAPMPEGSLDRMLAAAHAAPSVGLTQPWDFVLVTNASRRQAFYEHVQHERALFTKSLPAAAAERFSHIKIDGVLESTLSVVVTYDPLRGAPHVLGRHAIADAGLYSVCLAIENLWLAATAEELGVGWVSFYRESFVRGLLGIPESVRPVAWLCVGPVTHLEPVPDLITHGWRDRLPLSEVVHQECWSASPGGGMSVAIVDGLETAGATPSLRNAGGLAPASRPDTGRGANQVSDDSADQVSDDTAVEEGVVEEEADGQITTSPSRPYTLAIDIGGTGLKASVLDASGAMVAKRVRVATHYPMPPTGEGGMVESLTKLVAPLPGADRVSAGFPGMVRGGKILSAPHFVTKKGPGSAVDPDLSKAWSRFDLAAALESVVGKPTKVANDADVQGLAVIVGKGLELVITLGTGFGTAIFLDGNLLPHLELAHQQFRKGETFNEQLGEATRKEIGEARWNRRVRKAIEALDSLLFFDHLFIGGGNARRVVRDELGDLLDRTTVVDNSAGILGGIKLWEGAHLGV